MAVGTSKTNSTDDEKKPEQRDDAPRALERKPRARHGNRAVDHRESTRKTPARASGSEEQKTERLYGNESCKTRPTSQAGRKAHDLTRP